MLGNTETGYYSYYQGLLPTVHKKVSNDFWTMPTWHFENFLLKRSETFSTTAQIPSSVKSMQCALKCPPDYNVPSVESQTVPFTFFQDVSTPPYQI
eukprot:855507-Pelagomonas_calceolata.AAC.1